MRPLIVYWNNIPSPYMVDRFNALADRGSLNFEAWFNDRIQADRSWSVEESDWRFRYKYLPKVQILGRSFHFPSMLLRVKPQFMVSLYAEPSYLFGWLLAKLRGVFTAFWVEVTFDRVITRRWWKERLKRLIFPRVDAVITVGSDGADFARKYGARGNSIFFAPHVIDVEHFSSKSADERKMRSSIRKEMGLKGVTFIYVGRLRNGKGLDNLIDAFEYVATNCGNEVSLLLVGDGAEEVRLRRHCAQRGLQNVIFSGFRQKCDLPKYYAAADVFVFPTWGDTYGLVVDEAMACFLPVISTNATGEIGDRIENGVNGYIVPPESSSALAEKMLELERDSQLRETMGRRSYEKIKDRTPEKWACDFERIVLSFVTN